MQVEEPGLVEVGKAATFGVSGIELALEPGELAGEDLVIGDGSGRGHGGLAGEEDVGTQEGGAHLLKTKESSASARMLCCGHRRSSPPARRGSWLRHQ